MSVEKLLSEALEASQKRSVALTSAGMASVKLEWNPYQANWEAEANWSDNFRLKSIGAKSQEEAVDNLIKKLNALNENVMYNDPLLNLITQSCKPYVNFKPSGIYEKWLEECATLLNYDIKALRKDECWFWCYDDGFSPESAVKKYTENVLNKCQ